MGPDRSGSLSVSAILVHSSAVQRTSSTNSEFPIFSRRFLKLAIAAADFAASSDSSLMAASRASNPGRPRDGLALFQVFGSSGSAFRSALQIKPEDFNRSSNQWPAPSLGLVPQTTNLEPGVFPSPVRKALKTLCPRVFGKLAGSSMMAHLNRFPVNECAEPATAHSLTPHGKVTSFNCG